MEMDRHLFIIARDQPDLCAYLRREFSTEPGVEIILDRRQRQDRRSGRDRRGGRRAAEPERRTAERRRLAFVEAKLRALGYAMLRVD